MADLRIKDLPTNTPTLSSDYFVFEKETAPNTFVTSTNVLSSIPSAYRSGDTITEIIPISVFSASGLHSGTQTTLTGSERASFILDLGNTNKWRKSGCSGPTITWFVVGRSATTGGTAEWDLYNRTGGGASIVGSNITTNSNATWNLNSVVIPQANFPSTMSVLAIRSRSQTTGTVDTNSSMIQLTWTVL